jgi:hypothetical protein
VAKVFEALYIEREARKVLIHGGAEMHEARVKLLAYSIRDGLKRFVRFLAIILIIIFLGIIGLILGLT